MSKRAVSSSLKNINILILFIIFFLISCAQNEKEVVEDDLLGDDGTDLFVKVSPDISGLTFVNSIQENEKLNYFTYRHMYIGAGAATGDFNNDGLEDIYMVGNMSGNKLYINKGNFQFEDITEQSGASGGIGFYMGLSIVDVNNDGFLDIYLCKSGKYADKRYLENELLVNNGDLTFTNKAAEYGLNDANHSVQSSFFDYDLDGDLDMFLVNTPVNFRISQQAIVLDYVYTNPEFKKLGGNDKLYRNDNGRYVDVTEESGIKPDIGFGLSVSVADFNQDNYPDIFVANDFVAPDYLYINDGKGGFQEKSNDFFRHTSFYSMGSEATDINNDGLLDLMVMDMNPADHKRSKTTMNMVDRTLFKTMVDAGYNNIYMHNMLHLNNGMGSFNEIANLAGVANTDWSWSVLAADFDLDGNKDIHVTNGIYRDVLDRDNKLENFKSENSKNLTPAQVLEHLKAFPSEKLSNYTFRNMNGYQFENNSENWGLNEKSFSNGVALADFDNDGDLDMVVNNLMDTAYLYRNYAVEKGGNFLAIDLVGPDKNPEGIGATITVENKGSHQMELMRRTRGYLSGSQSRSVFGVDGSSQVDNVEVKWPDGKVTSVSDVDVNQLIEIEYSDAIKKTEMKAKSYLFSEDLDRITPPFKHVENEFDDYNKQVLLPYSYSRLGPFLSVADVNNDGNQDFYVGGAADQPGALYMQVENGQFEKKYNALFETDKMHEDMKSVFFDADGDKDMDLYVSSGGYEFDLGNRQLQDRLYLNDGSGNFDEKATLPDLKTSNSLVIPHDFDKDGDIDLFVGGRVTPGAYPYEPRSYLLVNENGIFSDKTESLAPALKFIGMVTDGSWHDLDKDNIKELVLVGEWMPISIFSLKDGKLINTTIKYNLEETTGWWQSLNITDTSNGGIEMLVGNIGINVKHKASKKKPFEVYASDFDDNKTVDIVLAKYYKDQLVPVRGKDCTTEQMPFIGEKFETFDAFADADVNELLGDKISDAKNFKVTSFESMKVTLTKDQNSVIESLPIELQQSPIMSIIKFDVNSDANKDIITLGNLFETEVETSRWDAGNGNVSLSTEGELDVLNSYQSGLYLPYDVKDVKLINSKARVTLLVSTNNGLLRCFQMKK